MYPSYVQIPSSKPEIALFKQTIRLDETMHFANWSDFEMGMARYAQTCESEGYMLSCLEDFTLYMVDHLTAEQMALSKTLSTHLKTVAAREFVNSIQSFYKGLPHNDPVRRIDKILQEDTVDVHFLTYNYTSALDGILAMVKSSLDPERTHINYHEPIHIHGTLHGPVLGVDNEAQLGDTSFELSTLGKRAFIKPYYNAEFDSSKLNLAIDIIRNSSIICVYGKRFGDSDKMWNRAVYEWLASDSTHEMIYYDHKSSLYRSSIAWRRMELEESVRKRLINELGPDSVKEIDVLSRIHVPIGFSIFNINQSIQSVIDQETKNRIRSTGSRH